MTKKKKEPEQVLFEAINRVGEWCDNLIHIIDTTGIHLDHPECKSYRIYHKTGYCWDVNKSVYVWNKDKTEVLTWYYYFGSVWEGFIGTHSASEAIKILELSHKHIFD